MTSTMVPTSHDWRGVQSLYAAIVHMSPRYRIAKIECFNRSEAEWIRARLEGMGIDGTRFFTTFLFDDQVHG
jgi:hypothetical protein